MYLRRWRKRQGGHTEESWALVESYRTARGPRQRVVAYLGDVATEARRGVQQVAGGQEAEQPGLFAESPPEWVEIDAARVRVERARAFGGPWLGRYLLEVLHVPDWLAAVLPAQREAIPWAVMAQVLVLGRLCDPSSELHLAEAGYGRLALEDVLGVPWAKVTDDRLYRALDKLLPHKAALEQHLAARCGALFGLCYDLLLYDVTSTYFEGLGEKNPQARYGYSRDHRPDCKQVCLALVVSREGLPLGYEVFDGHTNDVSTVEAMVTLIEGRYGRAERVWVMDRGMVSEANLAFLRREGRRYILGTPRSELRQFEQELLADGWEQVREGLEVKRCPAPDGGDETFVLCRSAQRREKERAIHARFAARIADGLRELDAACARRALSLGEVERRIGRLLEQNRRAAGGFAITTYARPDGRVALLWTASERWREWATLTEGCYLLRSNIADWSPADLWTAYIQLTQAEAAFRIHKSDLQLRPVWHQKPERVQAHLLVCFLAYVLWKTLGLLCQRGGLGDEPRPVWEELAQLQVVDVVLPTRTGVEIRKRCVTQPTKRQGELLQRLKLTLPRHLPIHPCSE